MLPSMVLRDIAEKCAAFIWRIYVLVVIDVDSLNPIHINARINGSLMTGGVKLDPGYGAALRPVCP
jgi:hypothetical protein